MTEMPKLKNILKSSQIESTYCMVDNESVYLKSNNNIIPKEYYKISPYEIDISIYGEIDLSTSFNNSYYSTTSSITLNTKLQQYQWEIRIV